MGLIYVIYDKSMKETLISFPNGSSKTLSESLISTGNSTYKVCGKEDNISIQVVLPIQQTVFISNDK